MGWQKLCNTGFEDLGRVLCLYVLEIIGKLLRWAILTAEAIDGILRSSGAGFF